jgi:hypothetical protein
VPAYSRFKVELAAISANTEVYTDVKDPVVDVVIAIAEAWADSVRWSP